MLRIDKILLPVDFSERSTDAARYANLIACRFSSELTMLHVVPPMDYVMGGMEESAPWAQDWRLKRADDATSRLARFLPEEFGKTPVSRIVVDGDPAQEIVRIASREQIDLIVLPTHGYGPFRKFVLGSVTAKVLDEADCPVFTGVHIAEAPPDAIHFNSVVCAVDFGPRSLPAFSWAAHIAAEFQARLTLVHALPDLGSISSSQLVHEFAVLLARNARDQMQELQGLAGAEAEVFVETGAPAEIIQRAAQQYSADLVVIGRHEKAGNAGRLRSNVYAIVRESPCPVVSV